MRVRVQVPPWAPHQSLQQSEAIKKAPHCGAFFVSGLWFLGSGSQVEPLCILDISRALLRIGKPSRLFASVALYAVFQLPSTSPRPDEGCLGSEALVEVVFMRNRCSGAFSKRSRHSAT